MKPLKMLGLAAVAALLAMAFVGASSAMANMPTALCTLDELPCLDDMLASHVHLVTTVKAKLRTPFITVECEVLFLGDVLTDPTTGKKLTLATPLVVHGNFTFSSCNTGCSVTEENGPALLLILKYSIEEATITGEGLIHVNCGVFINCSYTGESLEGLGLGPLKEANNGTVTITEQELEKEAGGTFCPATATLSMTTTALSLTKNWYSS